MEIPPLSREDGTSARPGIRLSRGSLPAGHASRRARPLALSSAACLGPGESARPIAKPTFHRADAYPIQRRSRNLCGPIPSKRGHTLPWNPVLWTLLSTITFSSGYILARRGNRYCSVPQGTVIATGVNLVLMTAWALSVTPPEVLRDPRLLVFCAIGLFVPGLSRLLLILSVQKVGASRSSSIRATGPLLATLGAILWLGETPSALNLIGILMIVTGGFFLSKKSRGETLWHRRDLIFPLAGTFLTAMRDVAVRYGLSGFPICDHGGMGLHIGLLLRGAPVLADETPGGRGRAPLESLVVLRRPGGRCDRRIDYAVYRADIRRGGDRLSRHRNDASFYADVERGFPARPGAADGSHHHGEPVARRRRRPAQSANSMRPETGFLRPPSNPASKWHNRRLVPP